MQLEPGTRIGQYEVLGQLGAGGMGVVYRARDLRLGREVACKILPDAFATDPDRVMRFEREARTLASLNHPHIAAIYGVEDLAADGGSPGMRALVMELVDGEDLAARLARGPMRMADALACASQIAAALAAAHDVGIIHRDLKPANIKITEDGMVKVLDFGLAKAQSAEELGASTNAALSPTITSPAMTQAGFIIGTAAYMAPEQAKGRAVDRRADVWAFGVVLYELLTGENPFRRADVSDTLAAVLTADPELSRLPPSTPPRIRQLIERCVAKDKKQRLDSMTAARLDVEEARVAAPATRRGGAVRGLGLAAVASALVLAFVLGWFGSRWIGARAGGTDVAAPTFLAEIPAPVETISAFHHGFALSPDGDTLVFAARSPSGVRQLWTRRLSTGIGRPLPGTDEGRFPFWSPSGGHIAFFASRKLRRIPVGGGDVQTICDAIGLFPTGSWSTRDEILFGVLGKEPRIWRVAASGGVPAIVDGLGEAMSPLWLPDGQHFLYSGEFLNDSTSILLGSIDGAPSKKLTTTPGYWLYSYAPIGNYLLINRRDVLTAQRVDVSAGALVGPVTTVAGIAGSPNVWFAVSSAADRLVAYVNQSASDIGGPGDPWARLEWVTRQGTPVGTLGERGRYWTLALTLDGRRVATNPSEDIWIIDAAGRRTRVTTAADTEFSPVWSPSGAELIFRTPGALWRKRLEPDGAPMPLLKGEGTPVDWSRDGRWVTLDRQSRDRNLRDIWLYDLQASASKPWLATEFSEGLARFSPDGRWLAYVSDASGRYEVYLRRFDGGGNPLPVSSGGGLHPQFRGDGRELYFLTPIDEMMAVDLNLAAASPIAGEPRRLFVRPLNDVSITDQSPFAVSPDGQRFLLNVPDRPEPLFFVQGLDAFIRQASRH